MNSKELKIYSFATLFKLYIYIYKHFLYNIILNSQLKEILYRMVSKMINIFNSVTVRSSFWGSASKLERQYIWSIKMVLKWYQSISLPHVTGKLSFTRWKEAIKMIPIQQLSQGLKVEEINFLSMVEKMFFLFYLIY